MIVAIETVVLYAVIMCAPGALVSPAFTLRPALALAVVAQISPNPFADLSPSWRLEAGGSLYSRIGGFRLTMQDDGNLVLYCIDDMKLPPDILHVISGGPDVFKLYAKPIWSTGTHVPREGRSRGKYAIMEEHGNFVVYDRDAHPVFETATGRHPGAFLRLQSDGNLVVYTSDLKALWASNTAARLGGAGELPRQPPRARPKLPDVKGLPGQLTMDLRPRWRLNRGDSLYSPLGGFRLILQDDGNLVLYVVDDERMPGDITPVLLHTEEISALLYHDALWSTRTNAFSRNAGPGAYCVMKEDGNLVLYDDDDNPRFQTHTEGHPGAFLRCQDDGNLVIYTRDNKPIWQTKTYARVVDNPTPDRP